MLSAGQKRASGRPGRSNAPTRVQIEDAVGAKKIAISDKAHQRLRSLKKPEESLTALIERTTRQKGILEFAGLLTPQEGRSMKEPVERMRKGSSIPGLRVEEELEAAGINPSKEGRRHLENLAWAVRCKKALERMSEVIRKRVKPSKKGFAASQTRKDRDAHS